MFVRPAEEVDVAEVGAGVGRQLCGGESHGGHVEHGVFVPAMQTNIDQLQPPFEHGHYKCTACAVRSVQRFC